MERTPSLVEILKGKRTDKIANGLAAYYDHLFGPRRYRISKLLEIGIGQGGSVEGWREFFPNALIYAIDHRAEAVASVKLDYNTIVIQGDVTDTACLQQLGMLGAYDFDIIIDDGSHINTDVFTAFDFLWPRVNPGGYYVVEDIQVPYRDPDFPTIPTYFTNFVLERGIQEAEFRANVLYVRKP